VLVCMYAFANGRLCCEHRKILTLVINLFSMLTQKKWHVLYYSCIQIFIRIHDAIKRKGKGSPTIRTSLTNRIQIVSFVDIVLWKNQ
jgi:hypothetical protein